MAVCGLILVILMFVEFHVILMLLYKPFKEFRAELALMSEWLNNPPDDADTLSVAKDTRNVAMLLYRESLVEQLSKMRYYIIKALDDENYESLQALKIRYEAIRSDLYKLFEVSIPESADDVVRSQRGRK